MTNHMWQINSNFDAFRTEMGEVGLDSKAPRATTTICFASEPKNFSEPSDASLWSSKKIASRKVFVTCSFNC